MRMKVRAIAPREAPGETVDVGVMPPPPDLSGDLGPDPEALRTMLDRVGRLRPDELQRIGEAATWRWWPLTLPPGGTVASARTLAVLQARAAGRSDALVAIGRIVAAALGSDAVRHRTPVAAALENAALALLTRDVLPDAAFDDLTGPWREAMHH
jgi:hypothetical protein